MALPCDSPYLVPFDGSFRVADASTRPPRGAPDKAACEARLEALSDELDELQRRLYAQGRQALLAVFQALDAAGKDSTIRAVMRGVDPAGCDVRAFRAPSEEELAHDFLWRCVRRLPERGRIGVFNRSYYEEVLVVRVHPQLLAAQRLPEGTAGRKLWQQRYQSIRELERHLARNGTTVVKLWLNVSKEEQARRFLKRIDEPEKNWKFSPQDVEERSHWDEYMQAYEEALNATSRENAPWYALPADDKPFLRLTVAEILVATLKAMDPRYPRPDPQARRELQALREKLAP